MAVVDSGNGASPGTGGGGGYPPPAHVIAGTYYDENWNEVNADGSPKTAGSTGLTYGPRTVDTDGSVTGIPGASYLPGSNGRAYDIIKPTSSGGGGSGGGGGAASQAGRYTTQVDTTGAIT